MNQQQAHQTQQWAVQNLLALQASVGNLQRALVAVSEEATAFTGAIQEHSTALMAALQGVGSALTELHDLAQSMAQQAGQAIVMPQGHDN